MRLERTAARGRSARRIVGRTASFVALSAVVLFALLTVVIPFALGAQTYTVLTGSMRPALGPGALIGVRAVGPEDVRAGDVITFQLRSGEPEVATHRVVGVSVDGAGDRRFTTKGDANDSPDRLPVEPAQLRGVVVYAIPLLGYANVWATPAVKSLLVLAVGVAAIAYGVVVLVRGERGRRVARRAAGGAAAVLAAIVWLPFAQAAPAAAAPADPLEVSADGTTWTAGPSVALFGSSVVVPGDVVARTLWLRNVSGVPVAAAVTGAWEPVDPGAVADVALARALTVDIRSATITELTPGASRAVAVEAALPFASTGETRRGAARLVVTVDVEERAAAPPGGGGLAGTGAIAPVAATATGAIAVALGVVIVRRAAARRSSDVGRPDVGGRQ